MAGFISWVMAISEGYHTVTPGWLWPVGLTVAATSITLSAARYRSAADKVEVRFRLVFGCVAAGVFASGMHSPQAYGVYSATVAGVAVTIGLFLVLVGVGATLGDRAAARRRTKTY